VPIEMICVAARDGDPMVAVETVQVVSRAGIVGDRKFAVEQKHPGQNITLVEAEEIERFNKFNDCTIALTSTRLSSTDFIRAFTHRCGLRADVLDSGVLAVGAQFRPAAG